MFSEEFVEMLAALSNLFVSSIEKLESVDLDDSLEVRHIYFRKTFPNHFVNEKYLSFRMVYEMIDVAWFEFVHQRNRNSAVSHSSKERNDPVGLVSRTYCHFITFFKTAFFKHDMKFCYSSS